MLRITIIRFDLTRKISKFFELQTWIKIRENAAVSKYPPSIWREKFPKILDFQKWTKFVKMWRIAIIHLRFDEKNKKFKKDLRYLPWWVEKIRNCSKNAKVELTGNSTYFVWEQFVLPYFLPRSAGRQLVYLNYNFLGFNNLGHQIHHYKWFISKIIFYIIFKFFEWKNYQLWLISN